MEKKENAKRVIDLSKVAMKPTIGGPEITMDMHQQVAEAIYQNTASAGPHSFALRLYESSGKIEATEEEIGFIKNELSGFRYFAQLGILKALGEKPEAAKKEGK